MWRMTWPLEGFWCYFILHCDNNDLLPKNQARKVMKTLLNFTNCIFEFEFELNLDGFEPKLKFWVESGRICKNYENQ